MSDKLPTPLPNYHYATLASDAKVRDRVLRTGKLVAKGKWLDKATMPATKVDPVKTLSRVSDMLDTVISVPTYKGNMKNGKFFPDLEIPSVLPSCIAKMWYGGGDIVCRITDSYSGAILTESKAPVSAHEHMSSTYRVALLKGVVNVLIRQHKDAEDYATASDIILAMTKVLCRNSMIHGSI